MRSVLKSLLAACSACFACLSAPAFAAADSFPNKPITIILPYATGGMTDTLARLASQALQAEFGQSVIVVPRPGAGGVLGTELAARARPDGYTLVMTASGTMAVNPYTYKDLPYKPLEDFEQVTILVEQSLVVVTNNVFPVRNLKEFIAYGRAHPGEILFGNAGLGTQQHLTQLMFAKAAGIQVNVIGYKGSSLAMNDLLGGHINAVIDNPGVQTPFIKAGKVRALFITSAQRDPALPDVPTASEAGLPGFSAVSWFGMAAPKGTPEDVVKKIQQAIARAFANPEIQQRLRDLATTPLVSTPAEATARVTSDLETFDKVAKEVNLQKM